MIKIYHNPRCSKSRQALQILQENNITPQIILYLKQGFTKEELQDLLKKLNKTPHEILRKGEQIYKDLVNKSEEPTNEQLLDYMIENPVLVERPIVVNQEKAVIGRPPQEINKII